MKSIKIHREGYHFIVKFIFFALLANVAIIYTFKHNDIIIGTVIIITTILLGVLYNFFRIPKREHVDNENFIYSPADGRIVAIEKFYDDKYFNKEVVFISIFMSITDVHVNFAPISGEIIKKEYFQGKHIVAFNPKSSEKNERALLVIKNDNKQLLIKQIAGFLARRIVNNWQERDNIKQFEEIGMIKFGSRVDIITPNPINIKVKLNQQVYTKETVIAEFVS